MSRLNDIKVTLFGDGGVGKTSLVRAINNRDFDENSLSTDGINLSDIEITHEHNTLNIKVWDFGGQEIYHSIHQLFLTKRTIYLVVIDTRQENNILYWLNTINKLVGEVPIIIVTNKIDLYPSFNLNERTLKNDFKGIEGFVRVSCKTLEGIEKLKELIIGTAEKLEFTKMVIPKPWNDLRHRLENINKDYLTDEEFETLCKEYRIYEKDEQRIISDYFHDLGVFIHFRNFQLYDTQVLNPEWITNAIYKIINSHLAASKFGILSYSQILEIFSKSEIYPKDKIDYIIGLMEEFELIFKSPKSKYVIPSLLSNDESLADFDFKDALIVNYKYDFLPKNLFYRVLIRIANEFNYNSIWRNGVAIEYEKNRAVVELMEYKDTISINVVGEERKNLLFILREIINSVSFLYEEINYEELIPVPDSKERFFVSYNKLLAIQNYGKNTIFDENTGDEIPINKLIDFIEPKEEEKPKLNPIKIFISYSHEDSTYKVELKKHLSPLIRNEEIKVWEDGELVPGQNWEPILMSKLIESDIVLCLISSDFIASDFCYSTELENALEAHNKEEKVLIPVFIRPVVWKILPFAKIQGIPKIPISSQSNFDEGWVEVVVGIDKAIDKIKDKKYDTQQRLKRS